MHRSKALIVFAHCILNQNSVVRGLARAPGGLAEVVELFLAQEVGLFQLPCPEFTYMGEARPSRTREEYDTSEYRLHCRTLLKPVVGQLEDYVQNGYRIIGVIGIQKSPSCGVFGPRGIFMEEFLNLLKEREINIPLQEVPLTYGKDEGHTREFLGQLRQLL